MNAMELRKRIADEMLEDIDHLSIEQIGEAIDCIKDLTTIEAMDKALADEIGDATMSAYMGDMTMTNLIAYMNHLSDDIHKMMAGSPLEHKDYVRNSIHSMVSNL